MKEIILAMEVPSAHQVLKRLDLRGLPLRVHNRDATNSCETPTRPAVWPERAFTIGSQGTELLTGAT